MYRYRYIQYIYIYIYICHICYTIACYIILCYIIRSTSYHIAPKAWSGQQGADLHDRVYLLLVYALHSFQTTLTPDPEKLFKHDPGTKQLKNICLNVLFNCFRVPVPEVWDLIALLLVC